MPLSLLELDILRMLRRSADPLSGRQIADITGVAPNTAIRTLKRLQQGGLVDSKMDGRATMWTTTADVAGVGELDGPPHERVALVVTAVDLEHTEVRNRLVNAKRVRVGDIWVVEGEVFGAHINWKVYLARAGMGNATSAALVGLAARDLGANLVAFVGTAAGLKPDDHQHRDVVVASRIHNPYAGKQVPTESGSKLLGRDKTYAVPAPLLALANACIADSEWTPSSRSQHYNAKHPHAYVAPIVSVEAVQVDPDGPVVKEIEERFQDAAALDMESFGLAAGSDIHDLPVLAIRGISDFIGDKSQPGNDKLQPRAARNAAGLLRDIMVFAHPEDFKRGPTSPPPEPPDEGIDGQDFALPGAFQIWMDRLERRSPARAASAKDTLTEVRRSGVTVASWLSKALHRPPAWLREDDTGDGWALVASLASWSGSTIAWRAFEKAAEAAKLTRDLGAHAYFMVIARLDRLTDEPGLSEYGRDNEPDPSAVDGFDDTVLDRLGPFIDFYRAILEKDFPKTKMCAEVALASLGLTDPSGVLRQPAEEVSVVQFDPELRNLLGAAMLRQLASMMLAPGAADQLGVQSGVAARTLRGNPVTRDLADDAMRLAQSALALRPTAEGTRLTAAQTTLAVLVSTTARPVTDVDHEISERAREVEIEAMFLREAFSDWDGDSGAALAAAARARSLQGDFTGALRMLRPAPDGVASQQESRHPEVVRLGAYIAHVTGDHGLALELAAKIHNKVEGQLMRAAVLGSRPQMAAEAKEALLAALEESKGDHHDKFQALMALARRFNTLTTNEQATVNAHIEKLGEIDPELAEVMNARVLISQGAADKALRCVRGLERNELALEAHADALVASNKAEEAARLVFNEGVARGDIPLATEALALATDNGLIETAREIALSLLARDHSEAVRIKALRALQRIAHGERNWPDVVIRTEQIIKATRANDMPVPEIEYWQLAEALYFQRKFDRALEVLRPRKLTFSEREKAVLFLTLLWSAVDEARSRSDGRAATAYLSDPDLYPLFMRAAADWADDEQIAAAALAVVLTAPDSDLTEAQISDFREYAEQYFERHGENASITRLRVEDDNLEPLVEFLRAGEGHRDALQDIARKVRAAECPLAVLTELAGRTTTESLIRRDLGCVIAVDEESDRGERAARTSLGGRVVVDTSALVIARWTGHAFKKLAANFDAVLVPTPVREDIARARSNLAMKSTATMGWDSLAQRPFITETSPEEAQAHADAVEQVWSDALSLQIAPVPEINRRDRWAAAITAAQELGVAIWADDVALRELASALGVDAFGSIDLIRALDNEDDVNTAIAAFRENKVVDLPIDGPWHRLAVQAEWRLDSPLALAISRRAAWRDTEKALAEFRSLIDFRPKGLKPEIIASWTHHAANGLALATQPGARPRAVSTLLAWVIINADPFFAVVDKTPQSVTDANLPVDAGRLTECLIAAADALHGEFYPAADPLSQLVDILSGGMLEAVGPEATSRIVAALIKRLDTETGSRFFAAYIQSAGK